jgi:hypothetical protein
MDEERCGPLARETMRWTRGALDAKRYLQRLPLVARPGEGS